MRIICLSDTHGLHERVDVPDGDILIHAGDFMNGGEVHSEASYFNYWLGTLPHKHKIVIAGNHDRLFQDHPEFARNLMTNATYLEDSGTEIMGLKFWGSPWTPEFYEWAFMYNRGDGYKHWKKIPDKVDVLITHGPPFGILDKAHPSHPSLGCKELREAVNQVLPRLHVFGHIHGGYGRVDLPNFAKPPFISVNAAAVNEAYRPVNAPIVIDL